MINICLGKSRGWRLLFILLFLPLATGCGSQTKGTVSGKVTYKGKLLSGGIVTFVADTGAPVHAEIQSDGTYRMNNAPLGLVKISVQSKTEQAAPSPAAMPRSPNDYGKLQAAMTDTDSQVPARYNDPNKSELTWTVPAGQQSHDIDLK